jgi:hypothetical protein
MDRGAHSARSAVFVKWIKLRVSAVGLAMAVGVILGLGLLLLSPLALYLFAQIPNVDWRLLSDIGQAYGAPTAAIATVSLLVVTMSALFQARAIRITVEHSARTLHYELLKVTLDDPYLWRAHGIEWDGKTKSAIHVRQRVYANMWVSYWRWLFVLKQISESALRQNLAGMFTSEISQRWWEERGNTYLMASDTRRNRVFCRIVDEEHRKALISNRPPVMRDVPRRLTLRSSIIAGLGALFVLILTYLFRKGRDS